MRTILLFLCVFPFVRNDLAVDVQKILAAHPEECKAPDGKSWILTDSDHCDELECQMPFRSCAVDIRTDVPMYSCEEIPDTCVIQSTNYPPNHLDEKLISVNRESEHARKVRRKRDASGGITTLNRLYSSDKADYMYSLDRFQDQLYEQATYKSVVAIGGMPLIKEDLSTCNSLIPVYLLVNAQCSFHILVNSVDAIRYWVGQGGWADAGIIGYGVLNANECGATRRVRLLHNSPLSSDCSKNTYFQTTNDTEYSDFQRQQFASEQPSQTEFYIWDPSPTDNFANLHRLYNGDTSDYMYSVDRYEDQILAEVGYKTNVKLGRIPLIKEDLAKCNSLVAIYELTNAACSFHAVVTSVDAVRKWVSDLGGWSDGGILGYAVMNNNECGATRHVRLVHSPLNATDCSKTVYVQTANDSEYSDFQRQGLLQDAYTTNGDFYVWE